MNRTKIVATLGPACATEESIAALIETGVNVFRINASHGEKEEHIDRISSVRSVAARMRRPVGILLDLQGPKFRTGPLTNGKPVMLADNSTVQLTSAVRETTEGIIGTKYRQIVEALDKDMMVLIDDGKIRLKVLRRVDEQTVECLVMQGGELDARKGINLPGTSIEVSALTDKDREDALMAAHAQVDYIALSFVQKARDVLELRSWIAKNGYACPMIIAKIEKPQALKDIDNIIKASDGLMVARGDLGVELPPQDVPMVQKMLVKKANDEGCPVIIATQMLESMVNSLQPARSDVSDIANAVLDKADALMLSMETATGHHPIETVQMMRKIIEQVESSHWLLPHMPHEPSSILSPNFFHAIAHSASYADTKADVKAIVVLSISGSMAKRVSRLKSQRPIIALTPDDKIYHQLSLYWGVTALVIKIAEHTDETLEAAEKAILDNKMLRTGDSVVFCAGKTKMKGADNMLKIYRIGQPSHEN